MSRHARCTVIAEGKPPETSEQDPGFVQYTEVGSGLAHKVKNVGSGTHREILVELKGPSDAPTGQKPQTNE